MKGRYIFFGFILLTDLSLAADFKSDPCRPVVQKGIGVGNNNYKGADCVPIRKQDTVIIHNTRNYLVTGEATVVDGRSIEEDTSKVIDYTDDEVESAYDYGEED